jgi:hypothetical protein
MEKLNDANPRRKKRGDDGSQQEFELSGVPIFLRDLLLTLPPNTGPSPGADAFIDHLRRTVLPPRPISETGGGYNDSSTFGFNTQKSAPLPANSGNKRKASPSADDDADYDRDENADDSKHDVFRQRRRIRMNPL